MQVSTASYRVSSAPEPAHSVSRNLSNFRFTELVSTSINVSPLINSYHRHFVVALFLMKLDGIGGEVMDIIASRWTIRSDTYVH